MMDIPYWILIVVAIVIVLPILLKGGRSGGAASYELKTSLLSPAERSFFGVLTQAVGNSALIFAKVRVADILAPQKGTNRRSWQQAFNRISSKHFDIILCRKDDLAVICAIELNDKSHNSAKRKGRDQFLREACESAQFPLIEVQAKRTYSTTELQEILLPYLNK